MPVLTILDTLAIQTYIFGSNRLKENIGGSELVKRATGQWVKESLPLTHNVAAIDEYGVLSFDNRRLEDGQLQAEVIYAGGGNTVILFNTLDTAKVFSGRLSRKLIETAPGLEIAVLHKEFDWQNNALGGDKAGVMAEAFKELEAIKRNQATTRPLAGLGVTAVCQSTGQAANAVNDGKPISAEVEAKLTIAPEANRAFSELIKDPAYQFEFPLNFDELGRSRGESSYIGVVHADGNKMGKRLEQISRDHPHAEDNRLYLEALRQFSQQVNQASKTALDKMLKELLASIEFTEGDKKISGIVPLNDDYLPMPIRPLVFGGDDLTFVCDGRLALTLTEFYLNAFEEETSKVGLKDVHACAGIAVVKSHYPFARAYQLAEALCKKAKDWVRETNQDFSAMDWHFAAGGLMSDLETIRRREYGLPKDASLLMRPLSLNEGHGDWQTWANFKTLVTGFNKNWSQGRNKIKFLREALRQGEIGYKQFVFAYGAKDLPTFTTNHSNAFDNGFIGKNCIHYDAIEAMDFFVPLYHDPIRSKK